MALAEAAGIQCLLGSTVELGIGTAAQLHLAASSAPVTYPSDLIGPAMYVDDYLTEPLRYERWATAILDAARPPAPPLGAFSHPSATN